MAFVWALGLIRVPMVGCSKRRVDANNPETDSNVLSEGSRVKRVCTCPVESARAGSESTRPSTGFSDSATEASVNEPRTNVSGVGASMDEVGASMSEASAAVSHSLERGSGGLDARVRQLVEYVRRVSDMTVTGEVEVNLVTSLLAVVSELGKSGQRNAEDVLETWVAVLAYGNHEAHVRLIVDSEQRRTDLERQLARGGNATTFSGLRNFSGTHGGLAVEDDRRLWQWQKRLWTEFFSSEDKFGQSVQRYGPTEREAVLKFQESIRRILSPQISYMEAVEAFRVIKEGRNPSEGSKPSDGNKPSEGDDVGFSMEDLLDDINQLLAPTRLTVPTQEETRLSRVVHRLESALYGARSRHRKPL